MEILKESGAKLRGKMNKTKKENTLQQMVGLSIIPHPIGKFPYRKLTSLHIKFCEGGNYISNKTSTK